MDKENEVHQQLTDLLAPGGLLSVAPSELIEYFDPERIKMIFEELRKITPSGSTDGRAVVCTSGPPGAGKSQALNQLGLKGYRRIDPDDAKELIVVEAETAGLLRFRHEYVLADGKPVALLELSSMIHHVSTQVTNLLRDDALFRGENVILDGTLSWNGIVDEYVDKLVVNNYEDLTVVDITLTRREALQRARKRWWVDRNGSSRLGGRFVPSFAIEKCYLDETQSICSINASKLVEVAKSYLGNAQLRRFELDEEGQTQPTNRTT